MCRPPLPPFMATTAAAESAHGRDAWNTRDPARGALGYTTDSRWRNRAELLQGREAIEALLMRKWRRELDYRLIKEVWTFRENRIAVRIACEWRDDSGHWFRGYASETWEFDELGLMHPRIATSTTSRSRRASASITGPSGRRPDEHPSLSDLGL